MKSTLKIALIAISFAFLTACGGGSSTETTADSTATTPAATTEPETPAANDSTATGDTTKTNQ